MKFMKTQDKNTQISVYCIQHYCKQSFGIIKQLLPALAVNIIIVHPWDVVFPPAKALGENNTPRVNNYDVQAIIVYYLFSQCSK